MAFQNDQNIDNEALLRDLSDFAETVSSLRQAIGKTIVGQEQMLNLLLVALLADGHVLLEGVPGIAKTLTAKTLAALIEADFQRIQFTPDLMPADVLGTSMFNLQDSTFEFHKGPIFSQLILIDEINRAPAKTQSALFETMEERQATIDGTTYEMADPFVVIATQNPIEQEGTYRLPEAQLDRFLFKITLDYLSEEEEMKMMAMSLQENLQQKVESLQAVLQVERLKEMRAHLKHIFVKQDVQRYMVSITRSSRVHPGVLLGASPRASLAFLHASRAYALLEGRDYVIPEDVQAVALPILRHRVLLTADKEMEGAKEDDIVKEIMDAIEVPR